MSGVSVSVIVVMIVSVIIEDDYECDRDDYRFIIIFTVALTGSVLVFSVIVVLLFMLLMSY